LGANYRESQNEREVKKRMKENLKEMIKEALKVFEIEIDLEDDVEAGVSYLESMSQHLGGGSENGSQLDFDKVGEKVGNYEKRGNYVTVGDELRKASGCGNTALEMEGIDTGSTYYRFMYCYRWLCRKCGSKGGLIHRKRMSKLFARISKIYSGFEKEENEKLELINLRQTVFTLPMEIRKYFETRESLQAFCRMCERVTYRMFPERPSIRYFHAFGDKNPGVFNPHVNVHTFEFEKGRLVLTPEELEDMKYRYKNALKAYLYEEYKLKLDEKIFDKIDVHYSFVEGERKYKRWSYDKDTGEKKQVLIDGVNLIIHRIKYMCVPHPGYKDFEGMKKNEKMLRLFVIKMKGFRFISGCGNWSIQDEEKEIDLK
jgi:hypothetical protein